MEPVRLKSGPKVLHKSRVQVKGESIYKNENPVCSWTTLKQTIRNILKLTTCHEFKMHAANSSQKFGVRIASAVATRKSTINRPGGLMRSSPSFDTAIIVMRYVATTTPFVSEHCISLRSKPAFDFQRYVRPSGPLKDRSPLLGS